MDSLAIDSAAERKRIVRFLRRQLARSPRRLGYVVGVSGGVDSAVVAALICQAVGPARVLAVLLPERESQPDSLTLGEALVAGLGIESVTEDLTPVLSVMGVYARREAIVSGLFPEFDEGWRYCLRLPGDLRQRQQLNFYHLEVESPDGQRTSLRMPLDAYRQIQAATNVKQRLRMTRLYEHAEARGYLVAGTTNRTETMQGFFVRYGDGGVDVEPIAHLLKTQVYELARHLEVPPGIIDRPASPDAYSAAVSDPDFFFRLPYELLDPVVASLGDREQALRNAALAGLSAAEAERAYAEVERRERSSRRLRELPPSPSARDFSKPVGPINPGAER